MTTTTLPNRYQINGLVDTSNNVLANMETLATTAGSLISFDATAGKWNVVILKTESTTRTFTDSDIIGGIQVNGSGLDEMYNSVIVEFPLRDTADEVDYVRVAVAPADRNPNEPDNELVIQLAQCNEPVQAEIIALQELKQNRADMIVDFSVDWTASDINPGDVVGITNTPYGWNAKLFRVITIERVEDGAITYRITAQQYDADIYDTSDLSRYVRSDRNGIKAAGAIGTPVAPQVTDYTLVARPRLEIETVVPSGLVESMEFWLSSDGTNYTQVDTEYPVGGGNFPPGTTVVADFDRLDGQDVYVKTRGMNSTTTGPFSPPSTLLAFVPQQQTEAIGDDTDVVDDLGNSLLGLLGANGLLAVLKGLMEDNETGNNPFTGTPGLFEEFENTFGTATGGKSLTGLSEVDNVFTTISASTVGTQLAAMTAGSDANLTYDNTNASNILNSINTSTTIPAGYTALSANIETPTVTSQWKYVDHTGSVITATAQALQPAFNCAIYFGASLATSTFVTNATVDWTSNYVKLSYPNPPAGTYWVVLRLIPTLDLNMNYTGRPGNNAGAPSANQIFLNNFTTFAGTSDCTVNWELVRD